MRSSWIWLTLGLIGAVAIAVGALIVRWKQPIIQGQLPPGDLQQVLAAFRAMDDAMRSGIRRTESRENYLRQCLNDFGSRVRIEVVKTNRFYVTKLAPGGLETPYLVTHYRGEWQIGSLADRR